MKRKTTKKNYYVSKGTGSKIIHTGKGSIAKTRIVKKKPIVNLEKETKKLVNEANARLDSLQRRYKSGTWASKKLANRLDTTQLKAWTKGGKIKIRKNATKTQLTAINKAVNQFLRSKTSSKKGIKDVRETTIETLKGTLSTDIKELTYEETENIYEMFGESSFNYITDYVPSSTLQACVQDAIDEDDSENEFIKRLEDYSDVSFNDVDLRKKALELYEKYVL